MVRVKTRNPMNDPEFPSLNSAARKIPRWVFPLGSGMFYFGFYMFIYDGNPPSVDPKILLQTAITWLDGHWNDPSALSKYGPLTSFFTIPFEVLYRWAGGRLDHWQAVALQPNLETALTVVVFFLIGRSLGYGERRCALAAIVFGAATYATVFSRSPHTEPLQMLLTLLVAMGMIQSDRMDGKRGAITAAVALVLLAMTKFFALALVALPVAVVFWISERRKSESGRSEWRAGAGTRGATLFAGFWMAILLQIVLNRFARGHWLQFGYTGDRDALGFSNPFYEGFFGLTVGTSKGFWYYSPVLLLTFFCGGIFLRSHPVAGWFGILTAIAYFCGYAKWWAWHGDWHWGPRFLLPLTPLLSLFLFSVPEWWNDANISIRRARKCGAAFLLAASLYVQAIGCSVPWIEYYHALIEETGIVRPYAPSTYPVTDDFWKSHFIPSLSPLAFHHAMFKMQIGLGSPDNPPWGWQGIPNWNKPLQRPTPAFWWIDSAGLGYSGLQARHLSKTLLIPIFILIGAGGSLLILGFLRSREDQGGR